jgi:hypothetical protein
VRRNPWPVPDFTDKGMSAAAGDVMSGLARSDGGGPALQAMPAGILVYDLAVAVVLGYASVGLGFSGVLLWPAVLALLALALWCAFALSA